MNKPKRLDYILLEHDKGQLLCVVVGYGKEDIDCFLDFKAGVSPFSEPCWFGVFLLDQMLIQMFPQLDEEGEGSLQFPIKSWKLVMPHGLYNPDGDKF